MGEDWPFLEEGFFSSWEPPEAMDALWAQGWRHFGTFFFRYSRLGAYRVLPLRVRLSAFRMRRSQRRVLRKNQDLRVEWRSAFVNEEVERLFERHKARFRENPPRSIHSFLSPNPAWVPCRAYSLVLYHREKLVGISYLDEGREATSSVYQCFEPEYADRSLGIFLILLSILRSLEWGKRYYYLGYAYLEPSFYDYKKRFLGLEGYDWRRWCPYTPEGL
ncbi:putative arginyl-tRNA--protein transferase [Meiothermus luteus]|uniref:Putative arginyl-tRNA--protein transferase n=2 Tax=Meiothermus luteus TaxID=2026184 RepID=A0A399EXY4_9DEIN|nr:putative arginyl-tRNA--protein transferase [Meiothermus luteus]